MKRRRCDQRAEFDAFRRRRQRSKNGPAIPRTPLTGTVPAVEHVVTNPNRRKSLDFGSVCERTQLGPSHLALDLGKLYADLEPSDDHGRSIRTTASTRPRPVSGEHSRTLAQASQFVPGPLPAAKRSVVSFLSRARSSSSRSTPASQNLRARTIAAISSTSSLVDAVPPKSPTRITWRRSNSCCWVSSMTPFVFANHSASHATSVSSLLTSTGWRLCHGLVQPPSAVRAVGGRSASLAQGAVVSRGGRSSPTSLLR